MCIRGCLPGSGDSLRMGNLDLCESKCNYRLMDFICIAFRWHSDFPFRTMTQLHSFLWLSNIPLYIYMWKGKSLSHVQLFEPPWTIQSMEFSRPECWVGSLSLLQGVFPTQGLNSGLPHCRWVLCQLSHKGSPRIPEWIAYSFSRGSLAQE